MPDAVTREIDKTTLRRLDPTKLRVGDTLPSAIRTARGRVLMRPGRVLRQDDLELLGDHLRDGIFGGPEWPGAFLAHDTQSTQAQDPAGTGGRQIEQPEHGELLPISVGDLQVGQRLPQPLYNRKGVLLGPAGVEVTERFLAKLGRQGIFEVHLDPSAAEKVRQAWPPGMQTRLSRHLDTVVANMGAQQLRPITRRGPRPHLELEGLRAETERARESFTQAVDRAEEISTDLFHGRASSVSAAAEVIATFMDVVRLDSSLLPAIVKLKETPGEYLFHHGMNVALLSMAMASEFAVPPEGILEIGLGALLQDVGMMQVPEEVRLAPRLLTPEEHLEIIRHPLYTLDFLEKMDGLSETSKLIVYQSHERADCSGYPRKRSQVMIHPFARLVGAADTYSALIAHRPHRNARNPYDAMELLLRETKRGRFDPNAVRALVDCTSLFPIGSYVRLSDGQVAKVVRANPGLHTKPVVLPLNPDGSESDTEIDLSRTDSIRVVQALGAHGKLDLEFFKPVRV